MLNQLYYTYIYMITKMTDRLEGLPKRHDKCFTVLCLRHCMALCATGSPKRVSEAWPNDRLTDGHVFDRFDDHPRS